MLALLAALTLAHGLQSEVVAVPIRPSLTDPEIRAFDEPHRIYVDRDILVDHDPNKPTDRHQLLLWLPGTFGNANGAQMFAKRAAEVGYHVVALMYPDDVPASACANNPDNTSFETFRMAIIRGGQAVANRRVSISIPTHDGIESRLTMLLRFLQPRRPREDWGQFLNPDGSIRWGSVAVAGQSQGGGHAALIGIKHQVARVICFGAPKDYNRRIGAPAAWYLEASATPKDRFFAFNHYQDPQGCTPDQLFANLTVLGLIPAGSVAQVDSESPPYRHKRALYTGFPLVKIEGENSPGALAAHTSAINPQNAARWYEAWTYLLTEPTS